MGDGSYNGFTAQQRAKSWTWEKTQNRPRRPCDACGEPDAKTHTEDYSEPYGDHIGQFSLCFRCHMAVHNRQHRKERWASYLRHLRIGDVFEPCAGWGVFSRWWYGVQEATGGPVIGNLGRPRGRTILDDIGGGKYVPKLEPPRPPE